MPTPTTAEVKLPSFQPQLTEAVYLAADESLMQFVVDHYYRRYDEYFEQEGTLPELGVSYLCDVRCGRAAADHEGGQGRGHHAGPGGSRRDPGARQGGGAGAGQVA